MSPKSEIVHGPPTADWLALKDVVRRFEDAAKHGPRPRIDDYLPVAPGAPGLRYHVLVELVHIELELRLKAGDHARVEEYLTRYPELACDRPVALELIAAEHELRQRREPALALEEYLQ